MSVKESHLKILTKDAKKGVRWERGDGVSENAKKRFSAVSGLERGSDGIFDKKRKKGTYGQN